MNMRGIVRAAVLTAALLPAAPARAEIIDRILAVVDRELITLTDVAAALRLGLVAAPQPGPGAVRVALDALIARQLELVEAKRYQPPEPPPAEIDARLETVRARFRTPAEFERALTQSGLGEAQLRLRLGDDLRIETYLTQRFGAARQPSDQEIADYYRANQAEFSTAAGVRPLASVRDEIRSRLAVLQREALMTDWLESLRRRTEIADLFVADK